MAGAVSSKIEVAEKADQGDSEMANSNSELVGETISWQTNSNLSQKRGYTS